jgi:dihydropteroate synthase
MPLIMGILNVTPDSFSDGGCFLKHDAALKRAEMMLEEGIDIIDVGGESTRPGACAVSVEEELERVIPVIERLRAITDITISIDTSKPEVMVQAVRSGATFINDINALMTDDALMVVSQLGVPVCLMHKQGTPLTMQKSPEYPNGVLYAVHSFFESRIKACLEYGIPKEHLILDPGFGFGKTSEDNLILTKSLRSFKSYARPLLYAASRKSTIGALLNRGVTERLPGGLGLAVYAALQGASIVRTHDIAATKDALSIVACVENATGKGEG